MIYLRKCVDVELNLPLDTDLYAETHALQNEMLSLFGLGMSITVISLLFPALWPYVVVIFSTVAPELLNGLLSVGA